MKTIRIATVIATKKRYIVNQWYGDKVYCWGEVCKYKSNGSSLQMTHETAKIFMRESVLIDEVERTTALAEELWHQCLDSKREAGMGVQLSRTGKTAKLYSAPPKPKPKLMTKTQFEKMCKDTCSDAKADGADVGQSAYDLAECLLYNTDVADYCARTYPNTSKTAIIEIIADQIHG
jgi:hypothetical protein